LTERLYWQDAYRREFSARAIESGLCGGRPAVVLDRTLFYPTSGGQPHDTGALNGVPVVEVVEDGDLLWHVLATPLSPGPVFGAIDWERRFDHMQQHSGQHVLSQAFERVLGAETVSFHLGAEASTIDLARSELDIAAMAAVEAMANEVIWDNLPVMAREYSADEAAALALRKQPAGHERIRVVSVGDFDRCACGGTHLRATGEIGAIHIRRWERSRGGVRVEFLCGRRAQSDYAVRDAALQALAGSLSVGIEELPDALGRVQAAEAAARRAAENLRLRLLDLEWPQLAASAEPARGGEWRLVCRVLEGYDAGNMRYLAGKLVEQPGMVALLAVTDPAPQVCFARAQDVPLDVNQLFREVAVPHGGRGGGRPQMAQGGGLAPEALAAVLAAARLRVAP
jgi:alanyl-tRNA synthetase